MEMINKLSSLDKETAEVIKNKIRMRLRVD